eukprot:g71651.t1
MTRHPIIPGQSKSRLNLCSCSARDKDNAMEEEASSMVYGEISELRAIVQLPGAIFFAGIFFWLFSEWALEVFVEHKWSIMNVIRTFAWKGKTSRGLTAFHMFGLTYALACLIAMDVTTSMTVVLGALTLLGLYTKLLEGEEDRSEVSVAKLAKLLEQDTGAMLSLLRETCSLLLDPSLTRRERELWVASITSQVGFLVVYLARIFSFLTQEQIYACLGTQVYVKIWINEKTQLFKKLLFTYASYMRLFLRMSPKVPESSFFDDGLMGDMFTELFVGMTNYGISSEADYIIVEVDLISSEERAQLEEKWKKSEYRPAVSFPANPIDLMARIPKGIGLGQLAVMKTLNKLGGNLIVTRGKHGPEFCVLIPHRDGKTPEINSFLMLKMLYKIELQPEDTSVCVEVELTDVDQDPISFPIAFLAHELRNPLTVIDCIGKEMMESQDKNLREVAQDIKTATEFMFAVLEDAVVWTQTDLGRFELRNVEFDLLDYIEDLRKQWERQLTAMSKDVTLNMDIKPDVPDRIYGDPNRLRHILWNIFANAAKFTRQGTILFTVGCFNGQYLKDGIQLVHKVPSKDEKAVVFQGDFQFKDTGPGMEALNFFKLMQPFTQIEHIGQAKSAMGLGMAIMAKVVRLMDGELIMSSSPGQGLSVQVILPFTDSGLSTAEPSMMKRAREVSESQLASEKKAATTLEVMIVEDNSTMAKVILTRLLQYKNIQVIEARNGKQAVELLAQRMAAGKPCPDLILMDLQMPIMDGYEATMHLRAMRCASYIVILSSLPATIKRVSSIMSFGAIDYCTKPMSDKRLKELLKQFCKGPLEKYVGSTEHISTFLLRFYAEINTSHAKGLCQAQPPPADQAMSPKQVQWIQRFSASNGNQVSLRTVTQLDYGKITSSLLHPWVAKLIRYRRARTHGIPLAV